ELRRLLEEGRVVLVALDDERRGAPLEAALHAARRQPEARIEVLRQAADQEARVLACVMKQPRGECARRRLAVRAADDERRRVAEDVIGERVRHRRVRDAAVDGGARLGVLAPAEVADDDEIGAWIEVRWIETRHPANAPAIERRAHRWI